MTRYFRVPSGWSATRKLARNGLGEMRTTDGTSLPRSGLMARQPSCRSLSELCVLRRTNPRWRYHDLNESCRHVIDEA